MCSGCFGHQMSGFYSDITLASDWPLFSIQATYTSITASKIMNLPPPELNNRAITCIITLIEENLAHLLNI